MSRRRGERWCTTDGTFFADMRAAERRILAEIDPEALKILDREEEEMERAYQEELARERNGNPSPRLTIRRRRARRK